MRRARKVDANQAQIVAGLRALGAGVVVVNGAFDLVVGWRGRNFLFEIKNPARRWRSSDKRTVDEQARFRTTWQGQLAVVETLDQVLVVIGAVEAQILTGAAAENCAQPKEGTHG